MDFSAILAYQKPNTNTFFRLRRYNGNSHEHSNKIEGGRFFEFHIHHATERYQDAGFDEDGYAEPTDRYADIGGALACLVNDCGFVLPADPQPKLF